MTYAEQLTDPRWIEKREYILSRDMRVCQKCMTGKSLQVHHKHYYNDGRMAWEYPEWELTTLCDKCHKDWHDDNKLAVTAPDKILIEGEKLREAVACLRGLIDYMERKQQQNGKEVH